MACIDNRFNGDGIAFRDTSMEDCCSYFNNPFVNEPAARLNSDDSVLNAGNDDFTKEIFEANHQKMVGLISAYLKSVND